MKEFLFANWEWINPIIWGVIATLVGFVLWFVKQMYSSLKDVPQKVKSIDISLSAHIESDKENAQKMNDFRDGLAAVMAANLKRDYKTIIRMHARGEDYSELLEEWYKECDKYRKLGGNGFITKLRKKLDELE
jgi:hypothetical protein